MTQNKDYIYILCEFNKKDGCLSRRIELPSCNPEIVREQFASNETTEPYIWDSHPVISYSQVRILVPRIKEYGLDFVRYDYQFEANDKS